MTHSPGTSARKTEAAGPAPATPAGQRPMGAISDVAGAIAHDFNNVLSIVIGSLDQLLERLDSGTESRELAGDALAAAIEGAGLTRRLLAFSRRDPLPATLVSPNDLAAGSCVRFDAQRAGVEVTLDLDPAVWPVRVNPGEFEEVLDALLANARDAMPQGGILSVTTANRRLDATYVAAHPGVAAGNYVLVEIGDTGEGIPPDNLGRIFEPFFTTRPGSGSGLGLAGVFGFVRRAGGHIDVYSEVGVGTTMRLYLPREATKLRAEAGEAPIPEPGGTETILAVDDNPDLRRVVVRQLRELGYRTLEAGDGPTALMILNTESVDLLFTDVVMPGGMSGYDLARLTLSRWPGMKALITTGFPDAKLEGEARLSRKLRQLVKPYRKADLAAVLREVLDL